jgi:GDPmannose 4,6-dehydratase
MPKKALITGITGQDGSYLAELLLSKGYEVHGVIRKASSFNTGRIDHLLVDTPEPRPSLFLHYGDVTDPGSLTSLVYNIQPDEIYHLGAQSHVRVSFDLPELTGNVTGLGTIRLLEAVRKSGLRTRFYQASSSEMFGAGLAPQNENTPFQPRSPYAIAKVYSYWMVQNYREGYGLFATNGILFNHESPRRGITFVTRKITRGLAEIMAGKRDKIYLGNLDAKRDWGFAPEYVEGMWRILQQDQPEDFVLGTGETHSVREFSEEAFGYAKLSWQDHIAFDPRYVRPLEVECLVADARKAREKLGWEPRIRFRDLVRIMVDCDLQSEGLRPPCEGFEALKKADIHWTKHQVAISAS